MHILKQRNTRQIYGINDIVTKYNELSLVEIPWFITGVYDFFLVESDILQLFC